MGNEYFRFHTQGQTLFYSDGAAYNNSTNYSIGDIAKSGGVNYYSRTGAQGQAVSNNTHWYAMPTNPNIYEIPHPYQQAELFDVHYVQSADVMTLVHPNHAPKELRRLSATKWELRTINFASPLASPTGVSVTRYIPSSSSTNTDTYETHEYVVTAVGSNLVEESAQSSSASVDNNIYVT